MMGIAYAAPVDNTDQSYIQFGVPETQVVFQDQSALKQESSLKSKEYQDFIHQLYRLDKVNLKKADDLFSAAGASNNDGTASLVDYGFGAKDGTRSLVASDEIDSNRQKRGQYGEVLRS